MLYCICWIYFSFKVPVIFGIIAIVGFFGNALVVTVVVANSRMRSTTNLLIVNLALADLLFIVFCVPFTASDYALLFWPFGEVWCKIVQYLVIVTANASIYTLVLMSLDRYLIVVHPLSSISIRTKTKTYWAIAVTWVFLSQVLTFSISPYYSADFHVPIRLLFSWPVSHYWWPTDTLCTNLLAKSIPVVGFSTRLLNSFKHYENGS